MAEGFLTTHVLDTAWRYVAAWFFVAAFIAPSTVCAAEIEVLFADASDVSLVMLSGEIVAGDADRFYEIAGSLTKRSFISKVRGVYLPTDFPSVQ